MAPNPRPRGPRVAVVGVGSTPFKASCPERTFYELALDAAHLALEDAGVGVGDVESTTFGIYNDLFNRQFMNDIYAAGQIGLPPAPESRVTTGGATGGFAVRQGFMEVASGMYDLVMVLGTEKCSDLYDPRTRKPTPEVLKCIAYSGDMTFEFPIGLTAAASYALLVNRHRHEYGGPTDEEMALVSVKNHRNAKGNPLAQSPKDLTVEEVLASPMITTPFRFYDCCLYSEGASALILASERRARGFSRKAWITGVGAGSELERPGDRIAFGRNLSSNASLQRAAAEAYRHAGITRPAKELDLVEVHDAFTGIEPILYEDLGLCARGQGGALLRSGATQLGGDLPANPSGGLLGCGHPVGATGVFQVGEAALQVEGRARGRQVQGARRALAHSMGGPGGSYNSVIVIEGEGA